MIPQLVQQKLVRQSPIVGIEGKMYSHGHAIARKEAAELGLPVDSADDKLEQLMWELFGEYEEMLNLNLPYDPEDTLTSQNKEEQLETNVPMAAIESVGRFDVFEINALFKRRRQIPPNPQFNINLNFGLPPGLDLSQLPANFQQVIQQLMSQLSQAIPQIVQQELARQSPIVGIEGRMYGGKWKDKTVE